MEKRQHFLGQCLHWGMFLLVVAACLYLLFRGGEQAGYSWHWHTVPQFLSDFSQGKLHWGPLASGLVVTVEITIPRSLLGVH